MKVGDLIRKKGDMSKDAIGLIVDVFTNTCGNTFYTVLKDDGKTEHWYSLLTEYV